MVNVSVVVPSWHYWMNPFKLQPMWELYYATVWQSCFPENECNVSIYDTRGLGKKSLHDVVERIPEKDIYAYWIMKTGDANEVASIAKLLKEKYPNSKHIAGGTHVDMRTEECTGQYDAVMVGPGERTFPQFVEDVKTGSVQNIYRDDYSAVPFADTPFPNRGLLPHEAIVNDILFEQYGSVQGTSVYFSRGCIYRCSYCVYNVPNTLQVRSDEMMAQELAYLKKEYGVKGINLRDEVAIHPSEKISRRMLTALGNADIIWRGQTTTVANYDQLKMARESGCQELSIGVETVDDQVMQIINKKWQTKSQIRRFIENAKKLDIKVKMCLIFGLPGEPRDIVERTIEFIQETEPDFISLSGFCPIPGSPIFNNPDYYGIKHINHDWSKHAHLLYRFSDEEEVGLPFEYKEETQWGTAFSREEIKDNIQKTQRWLESLKMVY